jgi:signal transduction histidine kinase
LNYTYHGFIEVGYNLIDGKMIEFYVKDTGIGISPDKQEVIFERFSQEDKSLSRKYGGLGLGLSIAKENTELLGGKIRV